MKKTGKISLVYLLGLLLAVVCILLKGIIERRETLIAGGLIWGLFFLGAWFFRPSSHFHFHRMNYLSKYDIWLILFVILCTILAFTLPMSLSPHWNGTLESEVTEYEEMTHAILKGQIWLDIEVDPRLETLENPYNVNERDTIEDLMIAWDHAYYNGRYYMYFGIVPVFLVFLPMYFLTGSVILSYQATQIITIITILGLFSLFYLLSKRFFPRIQVSQYIFVTIISACIILWYPANAPALYCTATLSGVCLMIWSMFFFIKAVYIEKHENKQIFSAFLGALFGALVVGCRPPIAIANLGVLPLLFIYLHSRKIRPRLVGKLLLAALPYFLIIGLLMLYNKARFDSWFEFGQSYQLTLADQREYADFLSAFNLKKYLNDLYISFFHFSSIKESFPFISYSGLFICFPILFCVCALAFKKSIVQLREQKLTGFCISLFLVPLLIILLDGLWSPFLLERYKLDYSFIICILFFFGNIFLSSQLSQVGENILSFFLYLAMVATIFTVILLFLIPMDYNYTFYFGDRVFDFAESILFFWHY